MPEFTGELTEEQVAALEEEALRREISLEELDRTQALQMLVERNRAFDAALETVLVKNRELYRRLA